MTTNGRQVIRRHKNRTDDGKGFRRMIAGKRFRTPKEVGKDEAMRRARRRRGMAHTTLPARAGADPLTGGI
jgi:hypothetical protein